MSIAVPIEAAKHNLETLLEQLRLGETITLTNSEGTPVAIVVSLMPVVRARPASDWERQWEALAEEVSRAWKGEKSAVEVLSEMRR